MKLATRVEIPFGEKVDDTLHKRLVQAVYAVFVGEGLTEEQHEGLTGREMNFFVNNVMVEIAKKFEIVSNSHVIAAGGKR